MPAPATATTRLPELGTHNGTGTTLLGIRPEPDGSFHATAWDVWNHMPLRPRSRHHLRAVDSQFQSTAIGSAVHMRQTYQLEHISDSELVASEVIATRVWHWLIAPVVLLLPLVLCLVFWQSLAAVAIDMGKKGSQGQAVGAVAGVIWLSVCGQVWVHRRNTRIKRLAKRNR